MTEIERRMMLGMISILNEASDAYYNSGNPIMSDSQFDARLEDLKRLEKETGIVFSNSPTQNVGTKILTELPEVIHNHKMLSLEKCHSPEEVVKFANNKELVASIKLDGLTISLLYENGVLVRGETRGDGVRGNDVTEHIKQFLNVPLKINKTDTYIIDGEAIITDEDFAEINKNGEFKNSRNLAAGTLSVLDISLVAKRRLRFIAWDTIEGGNSNNLKGNLEEAKELGFDVVPSWMVSNSPNGLNPKNLQSNIDCVFDYAKESGLPCDGIVFKFNDIEYGKSLGETNHHFKNGIAYKAENSLHKTELIDIEWSVGKSGIITPTAIFKAIEIEGSTVEKASLSNISVMEDTLGVPFVGEEIFVSKRNMIIPKVESAYKISSPSTEKVIAIPSICPICGGKTEIRQDNDSKVLVCTNDNCKGKLLGKLTHFVSKNAADIDGLSETTLEKFIKLDWLNSFEDIYNLDVYADIMMNLDGFGKKSVVNLLESINKSTNTTLDRFVYALSIPLIGRSASKTIDKYFNGDFDKFYNECCVGEFDFTVLDDFGDMMNRSINKYLKDNAVMISKLANYMEFKKPQTVNTKANLDGLTFCITGSLEHFVNRDEAKQKIESLGGKVSNGVSNKTDYLVCNEASNSSKYKKAMQFSIKVITENELLKMLNV